MRHRFPRCGRTAADGGREEPAVPAVPDWFGEFFIVFAVSALLISIGAALGMRFIPNLTLEEYTELKSALDLHIEIGGLVPKRPEQYTYALMCLVSPVVIFAVAHLRVSPRIGAAAVRKLLIPALLFYFCCWVTTDTLLIALKPLYRMPYLLAAALIPAAALWRNFTLPARSGTIAAWVLFALLLAIQAAALQLVSLGSSAELLEGDHLNIILGNLVQAASGMLPHHQYGFYAQFLAPLLRLTGTGIAACCAVMIFLHLAGAAAIGAAGFRILRGNVWLQCAFAALIFYSWGMANLLHFGADDPYFANSAVRILPPTLSLLLFAKLRKRKIFPAAAGSFSGLAVLWNLDSGVPAAGALFAVLLVRALFGAKKKESLRALALFGAGALCGVVLGCAMIFCNAGTLPDFSDLFHYQKIFASGFMMMWMPSLPAPWTAVLLVYLAALVAGIRSAVRGTVGRFAETAIFLAVLGLGIFVYYAGRSHDLNLPPVWWPSFLLFFWFTRLLLHRHGKWVRLAALPGVVSASLLLLVLAADVPGMIFAVQENLRRFGTVAGKSVLAERLDLIRRHATGDRAVIYTMQAQGVLYAASGLKPALADLNMVERKLLLADHEFCRRQVENCGLAVFCDWPVPARFPRHLPAGVSRDGKLLYLLPAEGKR